MKQGDVIHLPCSQGQIMCQKSSNGFKDGVLNFSLQYRMSQILYKQNVEPGSNKVARAGSREWCRS